MSIPAYGTALINMLMKSRSSSNGTQQTIGTPVTKETIDAAINKGSIERSRNNFLTIMSNRINAFASGRLQPKENWELSAAYLAKTSQPMVLQISDKGKPEVVRQRDADMSKFSGVQQAKLSKAMDQLDQLIIKQNANLVNQGLRTRLEDAAYTLDQVTMGKQPPTEDWQLQGKILTTNLTPAKLGLTADGNVVVADQTKSALLDTPPEKRARLKEILGEWKDASTSGIYTQIWQVQAKVAVDQGKSFYFDVNSIGEPIVKENTAENITPSFLNEDPYPNLGANQKWQKDALAFAAKGTPFFLDIDTSGQVVTRQVTAQNVVNFAKPPFYQQQSVGAVISLLT